MAANQNVTQLTQQTGSAAPTSLFYAVTGGTTDTGLPLSVLVNNIGLTGVPTVPTAAPGTNTTQIASTAYVQTSFAPLASPAFSGAPTVPTAASGTNTTQIASTAYVLTSYATPPAIGNTTANSANFTSLGTNGLATLSSVTTSSATISGGAINSTSVGATTPSSGSFTTLASSGTFTPSSTSGIVGTTTNNNVNTGGVGEYLTNQTNTVSLTTGTPTNITSVSLTAGDWDVSGILNTVPAGTTTTSAISMSINTVSATIGGFALGATLYQYAATAGLQTTVPTGTARISLATTTTVFLVASVGFAISTMSSNGFIRARRVR
jgi:hypothetical protein